MVYLCCKCFIEKESDFDFFMFLQDIGPVIISAIALVVTYFITIKTLNSQKKTEERALITKKLNDFYGPLLQLRMKSKNLYEKFHKKFKEKDENFSTLKHLLKGNKFSGNDLILLEQIVEIGKQCENLIHANAGLIDDSKLRLDLIPKATTHFLLLRLAFEGKLVGDVDNYDDLTFPKDLDENLEARKKQLEIDLKNSYK